MFLADIFVLVISVTFVFELIHKLTFFDKYLDEIKVSPDPSDPVNILIFPQARVRVRTRNRTS